MQLKVIKQYCYLFFMWNNISNNKKQTDGAVASLVTGWTTTVTVDTVVADCFVRAWWT